ncbi:unnamed protein product [Euphydryas editha]|uniref:C2H2-type domain-containing protein n=1 Tax=Euphydryas editha TaxID=104508 RepID=A0AAU9TBW9_EUPED|nr:unnamed protein product [Euphydryas editha]
MIIPDERKRTVENLNNFNAHKTNVDTKSYSDIVKSNKSESSTATNGYKAPLNNKTVNNSNILPSASLSVDIPGKLFCDSCNVWISVKKMTKHQNTMKHTLNTMTDYHYLLKYLDKDNLCCKICDVTVSNIFDDIINHFTNLDHIDKYDKLLQAHNITKTDDTTYYCKECEAHMLHKNEYFHIESKQHKDKISLIKTKDIDECTDKIETDNAVKIEPGNGNANETVKPSNAVNGELGNGNAIKTVEPGNAAKIELSNGNANETVEPSNAVNVELDNGNAIKTVEPGNAAKIELSNGNANETVEPSNAVNVELDNSNAIKTVEPGLSHWALWALAQGPVVNRGPLVLAR